MDEFLDYEDEQYTIYKIECIANDKCYVGRTNNIQKRFNSHKSMLRNGVHPCKPMQADFNDFGEEYFIFEVLDHCDDYMESFELERKWMVELRTFERDHGYSWREKRWSSYDNVNATVDEVARALHKGKETIRNGLQQKVFPWGYAIECDGRWSYFINRRRFEDIEGIKLGEDYE